MVEVYESSGLTGTTYKQADAKHPMTGYYLTKQELIRKDADIGAAKYEAKEVKRNAQSEIEYAQREASSKVSAAYDETYKKIEEIQNESNKQLGDLIDRLEQEMRLNHNLKRIAVERANKARNMDKHDKGYLILNWQPFHYKRTVKEGRSTEVREYDFYKITIQTPWDCSLSEGEIDYLVMSAISDNDLIVCDKKLKWFENNRPLDIAIDNRGDNETIILQRQYRSNVKEGFWEVTLVTTFEPIVTEKHRKRYS